jgi:hypothetical protein
MTWCLPASWFCSNSNCWISKKSNLALQKAKCDCDSRINQSNNLGLFYEKIKKKKKKKKIDPQPLLNNLEQWANPTPSLVLTLVLPTLPLPILTRYYIHSDGPFQKQNKTKKLTDYLTCRKVALTVLPTKKVIDKLPLFLLSTVKKK